MEPRISLLTLGCGDVARARAFYEALGWDTTSPDGEVVFVQAGGIIVALWDRALLATDSGVTDRGGWGGITLAHNVDSPAAVDAVLNEAGAAGAVVVRRGAPTAWGGYSGVFIDPEGHPWEVAHNPGFPLASDGTVRLPAAWT